MDNNFKTLRFVPYIREMISEVNLLEQVFHICSRKLDLELTLPLTFNPLPEQFT